MSDLTHIQDEEITQYVSAGADPGRAPHIRSHILECSRCEKKLVAQVAARLAELSSLQQAYNNRESREPARDSASLQSLCPLSFERIPVQMVDVSKSGFGVLTPSRLQPGTIVNIRNGTTDAIGTVRYCQTIGDNRYKAGIQTRPKPGTR